jgi:hypothetical protein
MLLIKIRNAKSFALGLFMLVGVLLFGILQLDFSAIILLIVSVIFILDSVLDQIPAILFIIIGLSMLIFLIITRPSVPPFQIGLFIVFAIFNLVSGLGVHLGFLPKWWITGEKS